MTNLIRPQALLSQDHQSLDDLEATIRVCGKKLDANFANVWQK